MMLGRRAVLSASHCFRYLSQVSSRLNICFLSHVPNHNYRPPLKPATFALTLSTATQRDDRHSENPPNQEKLNEFQAGSLRGGHVPPKEMLGKHYYNGSFDTTRSERLDQTPLREFQRGNTRDFPTGSDGCCRRNNGYAFPQHSSVFNSENPGGTEGNFRAPVEVSSQHLIPCSAADAYQGQSPPGNAHLSNGYYIENSANAGHNFTMSPNVNIVENPQHIPYDYRRDFWQNGANGSGQWNSNGHIQISNSPHGGDFNSHQNPTAFLPRYPGCGPYASDDSLIKTREGFQHNIALTGGRNYSEMRHDPTRHTPVGMQQNPKGYQEHQRGFLEDSAPNNKEAQQVPWSYSEKHMPYLKNPTPFVHDNRMQSQENVNINPLQNSYGYVTTPILPVKPNAMLTSEMIQKVECKDTLDEFDDFCNEGRLKEAIDTLDLLQKQGRSLDLSRYHKLFDECGKSKSLDYAKVVHNSIMQSMPRIELPVSNKILDMYCKCGSVEDAYQVFERMPERNLTTWDTLIMGFSSNGLGEEAIDFFTRFKQLGLMPDGALFISIFSVCSVLNAVDEGLLHFEMMKKCYGIDPTMQHYVSVVELLGNTGHLDEALEFVEKLPFEPTVEVWEALMNLSRVHGYIELGNHCLEVIESLDPARLTEQSKRGLLPLKPSDSVTVQRPKSLLEPRSRVEEFRAGGPTGPDKDRILELMRHQKGHMKEAGYVPDTRFVLHDVDDESKEEALIFHSERSAAAHAFLNTPARQSIRIIKNLRICVDCHSAMKILSKLAGREIICRDAKRFHHFRDGRCTCNDYW